MSISGNSFFENPDFEFYAGEDAIDAKQSDTTHNNLELSFWAQHVVNSKSLCGTVKIYTNGFLPEGVLEMTYTLIERSTGNLTFNQKHQEKKTSTSNHQSFKRLKPGKVVPERQNVFLSQNEQLESSNESRNRNNSDKLIVNYSKLPRKQSNNICEEIEYFPIMSPNLSRGEADRQNAHNNNKLRNLYFRNQIEMDSEKNPTTIQVTNSLIDSLDPKDFKFNSNGFSEPLSHATFPIKSKVNISNEPTDSGKIIFCKSKEVFRLKTSIERSALLIIPFKIFFKDKTLLHSIDETYIFESPDHSEASEKFESLTIRITHMIEFKYKKGREELNHELINNLKNSQVFFLHPDYDAMKAGFFERKMPVPSTNNFPGRLFLCKRKEIKIQLDRTIILTKNFNANITVSYPKGLIKKYSHIQIVLCQCYFSLINPENCKSEAILTDELNLMKQFVSPALKTLEFVYRLPLEKVSGFNLQSTDV